MVVCCVPNCKTDSLICDPLITFHDFPSNPDLAAKWIKQINTAVKTRPMWFPRGRPLICSKHFLQTDFKGDTDALRPRCIPTVFGYKYIGQNPEAYTYEVNKLNVPQKSPLIIKVIKPQENNIQNQEKLTNCHSESFQVTKNSSQYNGSLINSTENKKANQFTKKHDGNASLTNFNTACDKNKPGGNGITFKNVPKRNYTQLNNSVQKNSNKKQKNNELIEIGPNTFLKINPDIIKVNKKLTPSGNTVLQFLMDEKLAKSSTADILPKLVQGIPVDEANKISNKTQNQPESSKSNCVVKEKEAVHVLGHLVDTHKCSETCDDLKLIEEDSLKETEQENAVESSNKSSFNDISTKNEQNSSCDVNKSSVEQSLNNEDTSVIQKAPVLLTTNMPISHCFTDKPKYQLAIKQKNRQIAHLKFKISNLQKKIEELEDRCIVQERQLSYSFIKRLKTIRKNAAKGDASATYILEQIRSYTANNSKMRWSDSTLTQCAIWCRKAPYAYEYFKKADFFKLPCLGTVKRFMKKHPEIKFQKKKNPEAQDDDESSSDFDFESDDQNDVNYLYESGTEEPVACDTILSVPSDGPNCTAVESSDASKLVNGVENDSTNLPENDISSNDKKQLDKSNAIHENTPDNQETVKVVEASEIAASIDSSNLELQEIILPSGEVVQCYSSNINNGVEGQYFIIPNVSDQNTTTDNEYSIVQADSLPVILQNLDNSQLHLQQQDQLIFITSSSDQIECNETEISNT